MKQEKKQEPFDKFLKEFAKLNLTPKFACYMVYGKWPDVSFGVCSFESQDYSKYSLDARKEVVLAVLQDTEDTEQWTLKNTCSGLVCTGLKNGNTKVFEELDLWKEWGVSEELINAEIKECIDAFIPTCTAKDYETFKALMDYAHFKLSKKEAKNWLEYLEEKPSSGMLSKIKACIKEHTVA